jgi:AcrR family transcriptional regulator
VTESSGDLPLPESTSRADRKERTRQRLLDVTFRLIADRSLASISLREVARDAGIVRCGR